MEDKSGKYCTETIDQLATANGVRWYRHLLRRDDDNVLRAALNLEVSGKRESKDDQRRFGINK